MSTTKLNLATALLLLLNGGAAAQKAPADQKPADNAPKPVVKPAKGAKPTAAPEDKKPAPPAEPAIVRPARAVGPIAAAIDREVDGRLEAAKVSASPRADDAEFLRRVSLDLTGRIPTLDRTTAFLADTDANKRSKLIDELLARPEHGQHLATIWRNLIVPRDTGLTKGGPQGDTFSPWLATQFNRNQGWDRIVSELLTAEGEARQVPQLAFILAGSEGLQPKPDLLAAAACRLFLGVQLQCAQCHNHPFASWKQADFWSTAAFFSRLTFTGNKGGPGIFTESPQAVVAAPGKKGQPQQPAGPPGSIVIPSLAGKNAGQVVKARFLDSVEPTLDGQEPYRPRFASWVIAPENPYFANALVNRTWAQLFGRGFVNPVDNFHDGNPPSHPALLKLLADEFRASGHDLKHLLRCLCNSQVYQRTSRPLPENEGDSDLFSRMAIKPLTPEAFYDSLAIVVTPSNVPALPQGKKGDGGGKGSYGAIGSRDEFIRAFRPLGDPSDASEFSHGIPQFLGRMNSALFNSGSPLIARLTRSGAGREQVIEGLYLATLSRRPSADEMRLMSEYLAKRGNADRGYAGVLWILLNSGEFVLNH